MEDKMVKLLRMTNLVKSTLSPQPLHMFIIVSTPIRMLSEMDKLIRDFLWKD
jgi:hypothetical protein